MERRWVIQRLLFTNRFYLVPKCTLFSTASLKMGIKKEGVFQPSSLILMNIRNVTTPILVFFVIGEAVSILVSCDMIEIFYSTLKNPFLLEISSKSINFICVDAFSSLLFPHNKLLSICLKTYQVSLFICNITSDCLFS